MSKSYMVSSVMDQPKRGGNESQHTSELFVAGSLGSQIQAGRGQRTWDCSTIYPRFGPSRFRVNKHRIPTFRHSQKFCQEIISVLLLAFFQDMLSVLADASCTFEVFEIASNYGSHLKDFPAVCKVESGSWVDNLWQCAKWVRFLVSGPIRAWVVSLQLR